MKLSDIKTALGRDLTGIEHLGARLWQDALGADQDIQTFANSTDGKVAIAAGKAIAAEHGVPVNAIETTVDDVVAAAKKIEADVNALPPAAASPQPAPAAAPAPASAATSGAVS